MNEKETIPMASCFYCDPDNETRKAIMFRVGKMREGVLYLFKDQAHKGRCVVAVVEHLSELSDLHRSSVMHLWMMSQT